jgi:hypothetical protein
MIINEEVVQIDNQELPITEHLSNICLTKHIEDNNQEDVAHKLRAD